jgi:two-component sensor histidine kinase
VVNIAKDDATMRNDNYAVAEQDPAPPANDTDALIREADHRIANSLTALASLVRMQAAEVSHRAQTLSGPEAGRMLGEIGGRIDALGRLHRLLSKARSPHIDVSEHLKAVADAISEALPGVVLKTHWQTDCHISEKQAQPLALIVSEIITNSAKHAHPSGLPVHIDLACRRRADSRVEIEITDDGVGLPEGFDVARDGNLGWRVIRALVQQLHAELDIDSSPLGLKFALALPAN